MSQKFVPIANMEAHDQTASSELVGIWVFAVCLGHFSQATSV